MYLTSHYKPELGEFVDFLPEKSTIWKAGRINQIQSASEVVVAEARPMLYCNPFHANSTIVKTSNIRAFRTETTCKVSFATSEATYKIVGLSEDILHFLPKLKNHYALSQMHVKSTIQFLRGEHYYFMESLFITMAQNSKEISLIRSYFEEHLKLIIHFLSVADFSQYRKDNIYSSKENALCSSYVELFELTYTLLGLNYAQSLFRRENSRLMGQQFFEGITEDWVSNELVPTLQGFPIAHLPIRFIMTLYQILMGVVHIGISVNWESLSVILYGLYQTLLGKIRQYLQDKFEVYYFRKEMSNIFRLFMKEDVEEYSSVYSHRTEKKYHNGIDLYHIETKDKNCGKNVTNSKISNNGLDMNFRESDHVAKHVQPISPSSAGMNSCEPAHQDVMIEYKVQDPFLRRLYHNEIEALKIYFNITLLYALVRLNNEKYYIYELNSLLNSLIRDFDIRQISADYSAVNSVLQQVIKFVRESKIIVALFKCNLALHMETVKQILSKLFKIMPWDILELAVESGRIKLCNYFLGKLDIHHFQHFCKKFEARSKSLVEIKDFIDAFNIIEGQTTNRYIKESCQQTIFELFNRLAANDALSSMDFINSFLQGREQMLTPYIEKYVLPQVYTTKHTPFHEHLLAMHCRKNKISLKVFSELCELLKEYPGPQDNDERSNILQRIYEKRKETLYVILYETFRSNVKEYLSYFYVVMYAHAQRKYRQQAMRQVLPELRMSDKPFMDAIMSTEFCENNIRRVLPLTTELYIEIFILLLKRQNFLEGKFIVDYLSNEYSFVAVNISHYEQLLEGVCRLCGGSNHKLAKKIIAELGILLSEQIDNNLNTVLIGTLEYFLSRNIRIREVYELIANYFLRESYKVHTIAKDLWRICILDQYALSTAKQLLAEATVDGDEDLRRLRLYQLNFKRKYIEFELRGNEHVEMILYNMGKYLRKSPCELRFIWKDKEIYITDGLLYKEISHVFDQMPRTDDYKLVRIQAYSKGRSNFSEYLIAKYRLLYELLPFTSPLVTLLHLSRNDWLHNENLQWMREVFAGYLAEQRLPYFLDEETTFCMFFLDYCVNTFDRLQKKNYGLLLNILHKPEKEEDVLRNCQIVYLLSHSKIANAADRYKLLYSLLLQGALMSYEYYSIREDFVEPSSYTYLVQMVYKILATSVSYCDNVRFCFRFSHCAAFAENKLYMDRFYYFWQSVYRQCTLYEKWLFYEHYEQEMMNNPKMWRYIEYFYGNNMQRYHEKLYNNLTDRTIRNLIRISTLLKYQCDTNEYYSYSLKQRQQMCLYLRFLAVLLYNNFYSSMLDSLEFFEFLRYNFYEFLHPYLENLLCVIFRIMRDPYRKIQFLNFFSQEIKLPDWENAVSLVRPRYRQSEEVELIGLKNPHSVCYANSILQQLFHIKEFRESLLKTYWTQIEPYENDLMLQMKRIMLHLKFRSEPFMIPYFFKAFKNSDGEDTSIDLQMDADEFRAVLLYRIEKLLPQDNNFVRKLFNGRQTTIVKSQQCYHESLRLEDFSALCLEVKGFEKLENSMAAYLKEEIMEGENAYECYDCKKKVKASKHIYINEYPPYLTYVLKRFEYASFRRLKVNERLTFPLETFEVVQGIYYELIGIVIHQGVSEAGHYIALLKHDGEWIYLNDNFVGKVDLYKVKEMTFGYNSISKHLASNKNAYILFYKQISKNYNKENSSSVAFPRPNEYYGMQNYMKMIHCLQYLAQKYKCFLNVEFLKLLNDVCSEYPCEQAYFVLLQALLTIFFKITDYSFKIHIFSSMKKLANDDVIFNTNDLPIEKCPFFELIMNFVNSKPSNKYKSPMIALLVRNYDNLTPSYECFLKDILFRLHSPGADNYAYYELLLGLCLKDQETALFLNKHRLVGRIMDMTLLGIVGDSLRDQLLKTLPDDGRMHIPVKYKDYECNYSRFYLKWKLILFFLQRKDDFKLTYIYRNYLMHLSHLSITTIFEECGSKSALNYVSRYYALLSHSYEEYSKKLVLDLSEYMLRYRSEELRKYLRVIKELLRINDTFKEERTKIIIVLFVKVLKKFYNEKFENSFDFTWQWLLKIARKNESFRIKLREYRKALYFLERIPPNYLRFKDMYRNAKLKNVLHGLRFARTPLEYEQLLAIKIAATRSIFDYSVMTYQSDWDSDSDVTDIPIFPGSRIMKFNEVENSYEEMPVQVTFGDFLILKQDNKLISMYRGNYKLAKWFYSQKDDCSSEDCGSSIG